MNTDHVILFRLTKHGPEIITAPTNVTFTQESIDDLVKDKLTHAKLDRDVITFQSHGRVVCYRLLIATKKDRLGGVRRAVKVYDDADAKEPVS